MRRIKAFFATPFERRMTGDERAVFEDADRVGQDVNVQNAAARGVRHAVQVAADADHTLVRHAPLEPEDCLVAGKRQGLERILFFGKRLVDHPPGRRMHARIGNRAEPMPQLTVQIFEVAEGAGEEEVLPDIAERPLNLAFGLRPIGPAGGWKP